MSPKTTDQGAWDARKQTILSAALRVFAARGLVGTRITDLAAEAGVSPALLYHYFPDKEAVFTELVTQAFGASLGSFELACGLDEAPGVRLWFLLHFIFSHAYKGDGPLRFLLVIQAATMSPLPPKVEEMLDQQTRRYADLLVPVLIAGQAAGEVRTGQPTDLFTQVIALVEGYAVVAGFRNWRAPPPPPDLLADGFLTASGWEKVRAFQASGGPEMAASRFKMQGD